jgi:protein-serine/threonine kinase
VISACQYLHSLDPPIIHRDIKPENILLDADGAVKLADFGWSNFFNEDHQKRQTYCGTPEYLAPEMIKQSGHDKSLDIWNLGVLLFELLTGSPPFEGSNQSILFDNILNHKVKWPTRFNALAKDLI